MFEIIPNWHPVFVHFTVALLSLAVGLVIIAPFVRPPLQAQWQTVAKWALWFGVMFTILTGLTGLYAYNTVAHDTPSHAAMTEHRNWAIVTIAFFIVLAIWSVTSVRKRKMPGKGFVVCMALAGAVLASTAWHGGELVYRYGLGVMSLPKAEGDGHNHSHGGDDHGAGAAKNRDHGHDDHSGHGENNHHDDMNDMEMDFSGMDEMTADDGHDHEH